MAAPKNFGESPAAGGANFRAGQHAKNPAPQCRLDGYIKFEARHSLGAAPAHQALAALDALRTALFDASWLGMTQEGVGFGNISLRAAEPQAGLCAAKNPPAFIITASGTGGARELGPDGYCLVSNFDLSANWVESRGPLPPSSESMSHGAIYLAAQNATCVAHLHSQELYDGLLAAGALSTPQDAAFGTPGLALALGALAAQSPLEGTIIMKGHVPGLMLYAPSLIALESGLCFLQNFYRPGVNFHAGQRAAADGGLRGFDHPANNTPENQPI